MRSIIHIFPAVFIGFYLFLWSCDTVSGDQDANSNRTSCLCYIACQLSDECCTADCQHDNLSCSSCLKECLQNNHTWEMNVTSNVRGMQDGEGECCPETVTLTLSSRSAFFKIIKHKHFIKDLIPTCPADINISVRKKLCQRSGYRATNPILATIKCSETNCKEYFEEETIKDCNVFPELCCTARFVPNTHDLSTLDKGTIIEMEDDFTRLDRPLGNRSCHPRFSISSDVQFLKVCEEISPVYNYIAYGFSLLSLMCIVIIFLLHYVFPQFRNTHGKCLLSLCAALFVNISTQGIQTLFRASIGNVVMILLNSLKMYTWVSLYAWQMMMCINLYQKFRRMEVNTMTRTTRVKDCHIYSVIAWCIPLPFIITGISVPKLENCFENGGIVVCLSKTSDMLVFTIPVSIMVLVGVSCIIYALRTMKKFHSGSMNTSQNGWILAVVLRLQLLLGIQWIATIIYSVNLMRDYEIYFIKMIDILDSLQGVFIFVAFVTTKGVRFAVIERYGPKKRSDRNAFQYTNYSPKSERGRYFSGVTDTNKKEESKL